MDFFQTFTNSDVWQSLYAFFKWSFIILDAALFGIFCLAFAKSLKFRPKLPAGRGEKKRTLTLQTAVFRERWASVSKKASLDSPDAMRAAIIEADSIVDDILRTIGISGEHVADRLAQINPDTLQSFDRLWRAHRLRNELVHTPDFSLSAEDAKSTLEDYESFLREIGVLQ